MKKAALDFLFGLVGFIAVLAVSVLTREHQDIRSFALATFIAFFGVSFYRAKARAQGSWVTAVRVAFGGILPVVTMNWLGIAFTGRPFFYSFLLLSVCATVLGVWIKRLNSQGQLKYAATAGILSVTGLLVVVFIGIPRWIENNAYRTVDREIEPFAIKTLDGNKVSSEDWKGRVVVLSFWATWCTPCQAELPEIANVQAKFRRDSGVLIVAVNSGNHDETPAKAQEFLKRRKLVLNTAIDSSGVASNEDSWGPAAKSLGVEALPALYVFDRSGRLRIIHVGYDPSEDLADSLARRIEQLR